MIVEKIHGIVQVEQLRQLYRKVVATSAIGEQQKQLKY
jgi:hypothetical protein